MRRQRPVAVRAMSGQQLSAVLASQASSLHSQPEAALAAESFVIADGVKPDCSWSHRVDEPHVSITLELRAS